jgi:tetrahydromethanopterin S-methyltransferase subunit G
MSEFDMLKEKLAEAEERVRRLEAEKSQRLGTAA